MLRMLPIILWTATVVAACSPTPAAVTSTTDSTPASTQPFTTTTLGPAAGGVAFVDCLRAEGVVASDLDLDARGNPLLGGLAESLDTTDPAVRAAIVTCTGFLTSAQTADLASDPELRLLVTEQLVAFAECMRAEGIETFPDPTPEFTSGAPFPLDAVPFQEAGFDDALLACQEVLGSFGLDG
ncbi:MAG TPA: hypothetical protein VMS74_07085 [Acidimicrobiia bacterium]|nr:hypothetical protein [Acidimicrobiia bacterium]